MSRNKKNTKTSRNTLIFTIVALLTIVLGFVVYFNSNFHYERAYKNAVLAEIECKCNKYNNCATFDKQEHLYRSQLFARNYSINEIVGLYDVAKYSFDGCNASKKYDVGDIVFGAFLGLFHIGVLTALFLFFKNLLKKKRG